jgi:hypothetical protein
MLRIRFKFDGKCSNHTRYNPEKDGRPSLSTKNADCETCEALWVVYLYIVKIGARKAKEVFPGSTKMSSGEENAQIP